MKQHHHRGDRLTRFMETVEEIADWLLLILLCLVTATGVGGLIALFLIITTTNPTP